MDIKNLPEINDYAFERMTYAHENQGAILTNCDFTFPAGEILRIKSPEGSGKSTVLQLLAGLLLPQSGSYYINGEDIVGMSFEEFLPYRMRIGFTFDYGGLINNRSMVENLLLPLVYHKLMTFDAAKKRVEELCERFDLIRFRNDRPAHVPGRVRKLVVLLRGLITDPHILLLDDPSVGLSEKTQLELVSVLNEMRQRGLARHLIVSSYDEKFMGYLPHEVIHLDGGLLYSEPSNGQKKVASL